MHRFALVLVMVGCAASEDLAAGPGGEFDSFDDDDLPAGVCRDTGTDTDPCETDGTSSGAASPGAGDNSGADACQASADCMGGMCAATFDPDTLTRGAKQCQFA